MNVCLARCDDALRILHRLRSAFRPPSHPTLRRSLYLGPGLGPGLALILSVVLLGTVLPLAAADRVWTGQGGNNLWSTPANWSPAGPPLNGEHIRFNADGQTTHNDLANLTVGTLEYLRGTWRLTGNELTLSNAIRVGELNDNSKENLITIDCPLKLAANVEAMISWGQNDPILDNPNRVLFQGPIHLNGHELFVHAVSCNCGVRQFVGLTGVISGAGNLRIQSAAIDNHVEIGGPQPNTFVGTLKAHGGVTLNKETGPAVNTTLDVAGPVFVRRPGQIGPAATVRIARGGELRLNGHNQTFTDLDIGSFTVFGGDAPPEVVVNMQGATVTLLGDLRARALTRSGSPTVVPAIDGRLLLPPGTRQFDLRPDGLEGINSFHALNLQAQIVGSGGFNKIGDGALILSSSNTLSGEIAVTAGVIEARHARAFGSTTGGVTLTEGSLILDGIVVEGETLFVRGTRPVTANTSGSLLTGAGPNSGWLGRIELDSSLVVNAHNLCLLGGPIVGPGGLEFLGARNQLLGGDSSLEPSTFTGLTRVRCETLFVNDQRPFRGPLEVGGGFGGPYEIRWEFPALENGVPLVTVHPNGLLNLNARNESVARLELIGGRVITGTGRLAVGRVVTHPTNVTARIEGNLLLGTGPLTEFSIPDGPAAPDLAISAVVTSGANSRGPVKREAGELQLSAANTYTGPTQIEAGVLRVQHASALGTTATGTTVQEGATLRVEFVGALPEPLTLAGFGTDGTLGALDLLPATGVAAEVTLAGPTALRVDAAFATVSGGIHGVGPLTKLGAGTLQFGGGGGTANTYSGDTIVAAGILVPFKGTGVTTIPGHLVISTGTPGSSATVRHFSGFTIAGSVTVNRGGLWDLNGQGEDFASPLPDGRPAVTLNSGGDVQTGAGTLFLPAGGDIAVNPGLLAGASSFISGQLALDPGPHRIAVGGGVANPLGGGPELEINASIRQTSSAADLVKEGVGTLRLAGSNSFTGPVTINAGSLAVSNHFALGSSAGGVFVNGGASLALEGGRLIQNESLTLNSSNATTLVCRSGSNTWTAPITLSRDAAFAVFPANGYLQIPHTVSGPGGLTKLGPGTLQFSGLPPNTYAGGTTVTEGLLEAGRINQISLPGDVRIGSDTAGAPSATLRCLRDQQFVRTANVTLGRSGHLHLFPLTGIPTPQPTLNTLRGAGNVTVSLNTSLTLSNDVSFELSATLTGPGALHKFRSNTTVHVTSESFLGGPTTVHEGSWRMDGNWPASPVTVKRGATLRGDGTVGHLVVESDGATIPNPGVPGRLGADLEMASANFLSGAILGLSFHGPDPTGGNDSLVVLGAVTLNNTRFSGGFNYPPRDGDVLTLIRKESAGPISGILSGLPEGTVRKFGDVTARVSYVGGNGNDLTFTVTNHPAMRFGARLAQGNGNQTVEPDECNLLFLGVANRRSADLIVTNTVLRALTPGVLVTRPSAFYPPIEAGAFLENTTPFQFRTAPDFACGTPVHFELVLGIQGEGQFALTYSIAPGSGAGCAPSSGACESCQVVDARPAQGSTATTQVPAPVGAPSTCFPAKPCSVLDPATPVPYQVHAFTNTAATEACLTVELTADCPGAPGSAPQVAAFLDGFLPGDACANYLGDAGAPTTAGPAPFSFRVPPGRRFEVVTFQIAGSAGCQGYRLELFGLPCPPPALQLALEPSPPAARLQWSTAYPEFRLQTAENLAAQTPTAFSNVTASPTIVDGLYTLTNRTTAPRQFFRLTR